MRFAKRIFLFLITNFLVIATVSIILNLLNVRPFLSGYGINYTSLLIFCLVWGMAGAFISLLLSKQMAKWMLGVRVISPDSSNAEERFLLKMVEDLAKKAGLKGIPEVGIFESRDPNAFATGPTERRSLVAVSTALLSQMHEKQIEAILGHEIAHIANGDMVTMTLIQGVVNAFVMFLARALAFALSGLSKNRNDRGGSFGSYYLFVILFEIAFMILGSMAVSAFSRFREFRADRGGALLAGKESMISALEQLQVSYARKNPKLKPALQALMVHNSKKSWLSLFATHPPLEKRIQRLQEL